MLHAIIIEDEKPATAQLMLALSETGEDIQVDSFLSSVKEAKEYMSTGPAADIIFSDVQLGDGYSFEIFKNSSTRIPVIFITGFNEFIMNAFACNGIDYILKPINKKELSEALEKYRSLEQHFTTQETKLENLFGLLETKKKTRLIVRKGLEWLAIKIDDVAVLYTENKLVYVLDRWGRKYIGEKNLGSMELDLDENHFFRANRQYIININFIKGFRSFEKVKLMIDMNLPEWKHEIIVSQENAPQFRQWIYNC